jgi:hypothetical protein
MKIVKRGFSNRVIEARPEHYWLDRKDGKGGAVKYNRYGPKGFKAQSSWTLNPECRLNIPL